MSWLQDALRKRSNAFREYQGLPVILTPEEEQARYNDKQLKKLEGIFGAIARSPIEPAPERVILPMLKGDVEEVAAGMAVLNGLDFEHGMTEAERQPYREEAASKLIQARKDRELARQAELEKEGEFAGLDGH